MEDIKPLEFSPSSYFPFSNDKNDEYSTIENLLTTDMIKNEDITNYDTSFDSSLPKVSSQSSESENNNPQLHSHKKKKKKHSDISGINNPFMSARQIGLQPLTDEQPEKTEDITNYDHEHDQKSSKKDASFNSSLPNINSHNSESEKEIPQLHSHKKKKKKHGDISGINDPFMSARKIDEQSEKTEECDMPSSPEEECKDQNLAQEDDGPFKPISKLPAQNIDHQTDCKDKETKASKIKPVFGRPNKKTDHFSKTSKPPKIDISDVKSHSKKKKKSDSLSSEMDLDDPKSISKSNQCIIIIDEDEDSSKVSSKKKNEGEQIVPNFSCKKPKLKTKHLQKFPLLKTDTPRALEDIEESGNEKLKKKRSLTEISSAVLNSDHHLKKDSNEDKAPSEKKSREKKKKLKNSVEKCYAEEDDPSFQQTTEEACNIPKKKRKKSVKNASLDSEHEAENNGPVITNVRSLTDDSNQNPDNVETLCSGQNDDVQPAPESPASTGQQEHKKKKKRKSKDESPQKAECDFDEKLVKKHKKKKIPKESSDRNENVKVEMMPPEMVPSFEECEDKEVINISECEDKESVNISEETKDSSSESEESKRVPPEERVERKSLEKSEKQKQFSVKKKDDKTKKKDDKTKKKDDETNKKDDETNKKDDKTNKKDDKTKKKDPKKHQQEHAKEKSKKKCNSSSQRRVQCKKLCMLEREIFDTGTWVQCTNSECLKWRYLHDVQDPITVPMLWTCHMNSDAEQNDCSYSEISPSSKDDEEFIYTKYTEGTVVWARVDGYPWWPAMVEMDPDSSTYFDIETEDSMYPKFYHVVFFGKKVSRAWVTLSNIAPYTETKPAPLSRGMPQLRTREFNAAEKLAAESLDMPINTRLKLFSFSNRYKGFWADCSCSGCSQSMPTAEPDNEDGILI